MTLKEYIHHAWAGETLDAMKAFIRIPSKSSAFDAEWEKHGFLLEAVKDAAQWGKKRFPTGTFEILSKPGVTPALFIDLPATNGHAGRPVFFTVTSTSSLNHRLVRRTRPVAAGRQERSSLRQRLCRRRLQLLHRSYSYSGT